MDENSIFADENFENFVSVVEVLPTLEEAAAEVERLNALNKHKGVRYFWSTTRYYPDGRDSAELAVRMFGLPAPAHLTRKNASSFLIPYLSLRHNFEQSASTPHPLVVVEQQQH